MSAQPLVLYAHCVVVNDDDAKPPMWYRYEDRIIDDTTYLRHVVDVCDGFVNVTEIVDHRVDVERATHAPFGSTYIYFPVNVTRIERFSVLTVRRVTCQVM